MCKPLDKKGVKHRDQPSLVEKHTYFTKLQLICSKIHKIRLVFLVALSKSTAVYTVTCTRTSSVLACS